MFPDETESIQSIGNDLLSHADEFGEPTRLSLTTQLFPWLFLASRKMTTRQLSAWLEQTKGVKLSNVAIAKGLKRHELHLRRIAEFVQFPAIFLSAVYSKWSVEDILFGQHPGTGRTDLQDLSENIFNDPDGVSESIAGALETLETIWAPIPDEVKYMCRPYFEFATEKADDDSEESDD